MIYTFFSASGGVGKSTLCVHLAHALSRMGKRVLLVDLSLTDPSLDILCGVSEGVVYTVSDVAEGRIAPAKAPLEVSLGCSKKEKASFLLLPAQAGEDASKEALAEALTSLKNAVEADIVLIDAELSLCTTLFPIASKRILLTDGRECSLRAAESLAYRLSQANTPFTSFILCKEALFLEGISKEPIVDVIDRLALSALGIVPFSTQVESFSLCVRNRYKKQPYSLAVQNIASRLLERGVPLLKGIRIDGISRRRYLERARAK